jgi:hypothetical protein
VITFRSQTIPRAKKTIIFNGKEEAKFDNPLDIKES